MYTKYQIVVAKALVQVLILTNNLTLSSFFIPHCHSVNSHFKSFTFILTHASLRIILSNEGDEVYIDRDR